MPPVNFKNMVQGQQNSLKKGRNAEMLVHITALVGFNTHSGIDDGRSEVFMHVRNTASAVTLDAEVYIRCPFLANSIHKNLLSFIMGRGMLEA